MSNSIVSSNKIVETFINAIENNVLSENYEIDKSGNAIINTLISQTAEVIEGSYYRYLLDKNESIPTLAIQKKSLLRCLTINEDYMETFGTPARIKFILGFKVNSLIEKTKILIKNNREKKLTVNKLSTISIMNSPLFSPIANINIIVNEIELENKSTVNINAYYDFDEFDLFKKDNNTINSSIITINGIDYFIMNIEGAQYEINRKEYLINENRKYYTVDIEKNLYVFNVYKKVNENLLKLDGALEGVNIVEGGYAFDLTDRNFKKQLKISFDQTAGFIKFDQILIETIETDGVLGNADYANINDSNLGVAFNLKQNIQELSQKLLSEIQIEVSMDSTSTTGGKNEMTLEEIRNKVIAVKSNIRSNRIVTHNDLITSVKNKGYDIYKRRHDPLAINYNVILKLKSNEFNVNLESFNGLLKITSDQVLNEGENSDSKYILPFQKFKKVGDEEFVLVTDMDDKTEDEYYNEYISGNVDYFSFPYILKMNSKEFLTTSVYDTMIDKNFDIDLLYQNINARFSAGLFNFSIESNTFDKNNKGFLFKFNIFVNELIYQNVFEYAKYCYENDPNRVNFSLNTNPNTLFKIRIKVKNKNGETDYNLNPSKILIPINQFTFESTNDNRYNFIEFGAFLDTNFDISENHDIAIGNKNVTSFTLTPNEDLSQPTFSRYWINNLDLEIGLLFRHNLDDKIDTLKDWENFIQPNGIKDSFHVGYVFGIKDIQLVKNISKYFQFKTDVKLINRRFEVYDDIVYKTYENNVYETDENGLPIRYDGNGDVLSPTDDNYSNGTLKIKHAVGDPYLNQNGEKLILHDIGEVKLNENGERVVSEYQKNEYDIFDVPLVNSVYISREFTHDIYDSFNNLFETIDNLKAPDKINLLAQVKNTNNVSNWYYKSVSTGEETRMETLNLSLRLGLKFKENIEIDADAEKEKVILEIISYINDFNENHFSLNRLSNYLIKKIFTIDYVELYSINNLGLDKIQSFYKREDLDDNSMLSIKLIIEKENGIKILKPDILIDII